MSAPASFLPRNAGGGKKLALGLMSGTSADGVSIAIGSFGRRHFQTLYYQTFPYPPSVLKKILAGPRLPAREVSSLNFFLGHFFSRCVLKAIQKARLSSAEISVIGSHGQTLYHGPSDHPPNTLQIGEASILAEKTGLPVVSDFRPRDMAAGGEGAPLIPFFDNHFFGRGPVRALQNIGGIANVTVVGKHQRVIAFDTGPGNILMDEAIQKYSRGKSRFDRNGKIAAQGKIQMKAVLKMAAHPYFKKRPPKSTGRELFNDRLTANFLSRLEIEDRLATLNYFTAHTIHQSYQKFFPEKISEVVVSGGGAFNKTLMRHLARLFDPVPVVSIETYGVPAQAKEPLAFAFFALRALEGKVNHLPEATGAKHARILGKMTAP